MNLLRITPEEAGLSTSHVLAFLQEADQKGIELHSFQFLRRGKIFAEGWFAPYTREDRHILFSFTKSFASTAIGFAWQEGLIRLEERLVDIFPQEIPENPSENLQLCTVRDLLTMGCGHDTEVEWSRYEKSDWIREFLHHPFLHKPGTKFMYNTAATNLLVALLHRRTGKDLIEYLTPRLLEPLGIRNMHCYRLPGSVEMGGAGGFATTEDMSRFMLLVANNGRWEDTQLLDPEWFRLATTKQIENSPAWDKSWEAGYGFQYWMCAPGNTFRADGAFGQLGVVCRDEDAVFTLTAAATNAGSLVGMLFRHFKDHFIDEPLPEDKAAQAMLAHVCSTLSLHTPLSQRNHHAVAQYSGRCYTPQGKLPVFSELIRGAGMWSRYVLCQEPPAPVNETVQSLTVYFDEDSARLTAVTSLGARQELPVSMTSSYNRFSLDDRDFAAVGGWTGPSEFSFQVRCLNAATGTCFTLRFSDAGMELKISPSIPDYNGLGDQEREKILFDVKPIEN